MIKKNCLLVFEPFFQGNRDMSQFALEPCGIEGFCKLLAGILGRFRALSLLLAPSKRNLSKHFPIQIDKIIKFT